MSNAYRIVIVLVCLVLLSGIAQAYVFFHANNNQDTPYYWWGNEVTIPIGNMRVSRPNTEDYYGAMLQAMAAWNTQSGFTFRYTDNNVSACPATASSGGVTTGVSFQPDNCGEPFLGSRVLAIAQTGSIQNSSKEDTGRLSGARIIFNSTANWGIHDRTDGRNQPYDFRRVAIHELGHILGLDHPDEASPTQVVTSIMDSFYETSVAVLQPDDISGARALYGATDVNVAQGLDNTVLTFDHSGNGEPWFGTSGDYGGQLPLPPDGDVALSGDIGFNVSRERSCIETTVAEEGTVSFQWFVSSHNRNFLLFEINDNELEAISGEVAWRTETFPVDQPNSVLRWCYRKNSTNIEGLDGGGVNALVYSGVTPVEAPTVVASEGRSTQYIDLSWNAIARARSYIVSRADILNSVSVAISTVTATTYRDTAVVPGRFYDYRVQACTQADGQGTCSESSAVASGYSALSPPTNVSASLGTNRDGITLRWNAAVGAARYEVLREGQSDPIGTTRTLTYHDTSLPQPSSCTLMSYTVRACSDDTRIACSGESRITRGYRGRSSTGTVSVVTDINPQGNGVYRNAPADMPTGITACALDDGSISYSLSDDAGGLFKISSASGIVRTNTMLTPTTDTYIIIVQALSDDGDASTQSFVITAFNAIRLHIKLFLEGPLQ